MKIITGLLSVVLQNEVKRLTEDNEVLKKTLGLEKEKLHALEAAVEDLHKKGECSLPLSISLYMYLSIGPSLFLLSQILFSPFVFSYPCILSSSFSLFLCLSLFFFLIYLLLMILL